MFYQATVGDDVRSLLCLYQATVGDDVRSL